MLLSGGVGLTPLISMMNAIVQNGSGRRVWFIHGTRNGREHAMGTHVRRLEPFCTIAFNMLISGVRPTPPLKSTTVRSLSGSR